MPAMIVSRLATIEPSNVALIVSRLSASGTAGQYSGTAVASPDAPSGGNVARITAGTDVTSNTAFLSQTVPITNPALPVSVQGAARRVSTLGPQKVALSVLAYDSTGAFLSTVGSVQIDASGTAFGVGELQNLTLPTTTASIRYAWYPLVPNFPWSATGSVDVDAGMVELASTTGPYFDGSTPSTTSTVYGYTGDPASSTSTESTFVLTGWTAEHGAEFPIQTSTPTGGYFGPGGDVYSGLMSVGAYGAASMSVSTQDNATVRIILHDGTKTVADTGTFSPTTTPTRVDALASAATAANSARIVVYVTTGHVKIEQILVEAVGGAGEGTGYYFDGSGADSSDFPYTYAWLGVVNGSASTQSGRAVPSIYSYNKYVTVSFAASYAVGSQYVARTLATISGIHPTLASMPYPIPVVPGQKFSCSFLIRLTPGATPTNTVRVALGAYANGSGKGMLTGGTATVPSKLSDSAWSLVKLENWTVPTDTTINGAGIQISPAQYWLADEGYEISALITENAPTVGPYFSGGTVSTTKRFSYIWDASPDNSASEEVYNTPNGALLGTYVQLGDVVSLGWINPDGTEFYLDNIQGWEASASTIQVIQKPRAHGGVAGEAFLKPKPMILVGSVSAPDLDSAHDAEELLLKGVPLDEITMTVTEGNRIRTSNVRRTDTPIITWTSDTAFDYSLAVVAVDPRRLGGALTAATSLPQSVGGLTIPFTVPFSINATVSSGQVTLTNDGEYQGPVLLRINGPINGPIVHHTGSSGVRTIAFPTLNLGVGEFLDIDMEAHTAQAQGSVSRTAWMTVREWSLFDPGVNTWQFAATNSATNYPTPPTLTVTAYPAS